MAILSNIWAGRYLKMIELNERVIEGRGKYFVMIDFKDARNNRKRLSASTDLEVGIKGNKEIVEEVSKYVGDELRDLNNTNEIEKKVIKMITEYALNCFKNDEVPISLGWFEKEKEKVQAKKIRAISRITLNQKNAEIFFADYLDEWLKKHQILSDIELNTYGSYQGNVTVIKEFLNKEYPDVRLCEITTDHIFEFYQYCYSVRKNSKNTVKHHLVLLSAAFEYAMNEELIERNPMTKVKCPKIDKIEVKVLNIDECMRLMKALEDDMIETICYMTVFYGFRRSEALGLKWEYIDFVNKQIRVRHTVVDTVVDHERVELRKDKTKNKKSRRTYPLVPFIENLLLKLKARQDYQKKICGSSYDYKDYEYVFVNELGKLLKPDFVTRRFTQIVKQADLPKVTFKGLRHTCATIQLLNGMSMNDTREWLGHSNITTTVKTYGHYSNERKQVVGETLVGLLNLNSSQDLTQNA